MEKYPSLTFFISLSLSLSLKVLDAILGQKLTSSSARSSLLSLRWFLWRFRHTLFSFKDTSYCGTLAYHVLRYSNSPHGVIRMDAGALFLSMLRLNYACRGNIARMKLQATIAISRLAEADTACYDHIREVLRSVGVMIEEVGCIKEVCVCSVSLSLSHTHNIHSLSLTPPPSLSVSLSLSHFISNVLLLSADRTRLLILRTFRRSGVTLQSSPRNT